METSKNGKSKANSKHQKKKETITDFDKTIQSMYEYLTSPVHSSMYQSIFSKEEINKMKEIKRSDVKKRRFKKWYNMIYSKRKLNQMQSTPNSDLSESITKSKMCSSLCLGSTSFMSAHSVIVKGNDYLNKTSMSLTTESEKGINDFYNKNKEVFKLRVFKCPPDVFRKYAWFTSAKIPLIRNSSHYYNVLRHNLDPNIENQINKDILRTMEEQEINLPDLQEPLFRVLKALALLDRELSYCQGMNFVVAFILIVMKGNEVDSFYFCVALFSQTYSNDFGIRGFYLDDFPLLNLYMFIFEYHFKKKMSKLYLKLKSFEIPSHCWVGKWFQTLFVNTFSEAIVARIWDGLLAFGIQFIISIALGMINHLESQLLRLDDVVDIVNFFRELTKQHSANKVDHYHSNNKCKPIRFDIEEILQKAKTKYYLRDDDMKDLIAIFFERNIKENHVDNEYDDEEEEDKITKVMNCINTRVEYDLENYERNQTLYEVKNKEGLYATDNKENISNNITINKTPIIGNEYCYKDNDNNNNNNQYTRIDTIYDADINEFYLNTLESNGKKFEKPVPTKHLFRNPFVSEFII